MRRRWLVSLVPPDATGSGLRQLPHDGGQVHPDILPADLAALRELDHVQQAEFEGAALAFEAEGPGHHPALPWQEAPLFMADLRGRDAMAARALEFAILAAARTSEVLGARWREMDLDAAVWTVPAERMKAKREHRVPLSDAALAVLRAVLPLSTGPDSFVFPGKRRGHGLSQMALLMLLRRMNPQGEDKPARWRDARTGEPITAHGFRSTFRDWCGEASHHPADLAEAALAHVNKDKTEAAYARGDLFAKRAVLMADWAAFCAKPPAEVVAIQGARRAAAQ